MKEKEVQGRETELDLKPVLWASQTYLVLSDNK